MVLRTSETRENINRDIYLITIRKSKTNEECKASELLATVATLNLFNVKTSQLCFELAKTNLHLHTIGSLPKYTKYKSMLTDAPKGIFIHFARLKTQADIQRSLNYIRKQATTNPPDFLQTEQYFRFNYGFDDAEEMSRLKDNDKRF